MIEVTLLSMQDCHMCERAKEVLAKLGREHFLSITTLDWDSKEGVDLRDKEGIPFSPAVFINGQLAGYGRVSEGRLRKKLEAIR